jgi:hypothetical protein
VAFVAFAGADATMPLDSANSQSARDFHEFDLASALLASVFWAVVRWGLTGRRRLGNRGAARSWP